MTIDAMTTLDAVCDMHHQLDTSCGKQHSLITNGICYTCTTKAPLITTSYKEGSGDKGYTTTGATHTSPTKRERKGEVNLTVVWGRLSKLQIAIKETTPKFLQEDTRTLLTWFWENVRSISSLVYLEGASDTHAFPKQALTYMERVIKEMKVEMGPSPSFIQWEDTDLLEMEYLWAEVRETEVMLQEWANKAPIEESVQHKVELVLSIINRLSSYLWWSMRYENKLRGLPEHVWQEHVTPFPL